MTPPAPVGFDLDMTLIDSQRAILGSFAAVAADTGVAIDPAGVRSRLGIKLEAELAHWFPPGEVDEAVRVYRAHYLTLLRPMTRLLPGAAETLAAVRAAGVKQVDRFRRDDAGQAGRTVNDVDGLIAKHVQVCGRPGSNTLPGNTMPIARRSSRKRGRMPVASK